MASRPFVTGSTHDLLDYGVEETDERIDLGPELTTRFRRRAEHRRDRLNARRVVPFYRWEIVRENRRWTVAAFQNRARPKPE